MLRDSFSRKHDYLRISITDKCNLRCRYCMPAEGVKLLSHDEILRNEEFIKLIKIFGEMGVKKIRFTGGEPLVRKGFTGIIKGARKLFPEIELCLTTNGILLGDYIDELIGLKIKKLNISLDTISAERYEKITGSNSIDLVLSNIEKVERRNFFDLKINCVLFKETLDWLDEYLNYFKNKNVTIRFIERMPFTGEDEVQSFIPSDLFLDSLRKRGRLSRNKNYDSHVAVMYDYRYLNSYPMKIGVIPPMTHKFCSSCNRLRLTSEGLLKTCLYSQHQLNLKELIRKSIDDEKIKEEIKKSLFNKNREHKMDCFSEDGGCSAITLAGAMSKIGG